MKQQLLAEMKNLAEKINETDSEMGFYALRKLEYLNEDSSLEAITRSGNDIALIAEKVFGK